MRGWYTVNTRWSVAVLESGLGLGLGSGLGSGLGWTNRAHMDHFIDTLTKLYQIKINWEGTRYLGTDIAINRIERHVTLSMPKYIDRLLCKIRPDGIRGSNTPAVYAPPNYANSGAQKATVDKSQLASEDDKNKLQSVVGTLLYYSRAVDPSICTAVHELGSIQFNPSQNDMKKMEKLLQYVSKHRNMGIRFYASLMLLPGKISLRFILLLGCRKFYKWTYQLS